MENNTIDQRLYSLDALRGFDMLCIMGLDHFFHSMKNATGSPSVAISNLHTADQANLPSGGIQSDPCPVWDDMDVIPHTIMSFE